MQGDDTNVLRRRLEELRLEHRDLDEIIDRLSRDPATDQLQLRRLKKRKLAVKDAMARIASEMIPDLDD